MAYIQIPAFTKINTLDNDTEFVIVIDGIEYLVTFKTLSDKFGNTPELLQQINAEIEALRAIVDALPTENPAAPIALKISDNPIIDGIYKPVETGTYPNAGGLVYDPTEGITYFIRTQGVWTKDVTPINFTPIGVVEEGNTQAVSGGEVYGYTLLKGDFDLILDFESLDFSSNIENGKAITSGGVIVDAVGFVSVVKLRPPFCKHFRFNGNAFQLDAKFICQYDYEGNMIRVNEVRNGLQIIPRLNDTTHISFTIKSPDDTSEPSVTLDVDSNGVFINGYKNQNITSYDKFLIDSKPWLYANVGYTPSGSAVDATGYYATVTIPRFYSKTVIISGITPSVDSKYFVQKSDKNDTILSTEIKQIPFTIDLLPNCAFYGFTVKDPGETNNDSLENLNISIINKNGTFSEFGQKYKGKKIVSFGDSVDWYDGNHFGSETKDADVLAIGWQSYVRFFLGAKVDNQGNNGWDMTQILSTIKSYNYADVDKVTLKTGANDHRKGVPIGTLMPIGSAFDNTTYIGAMQEGIEYILNYKRSTEIRLISPLRGWFTENGTPDVPNLYKGEFEISVDYVNAMKEVAELYSIPFIDIYHNSMINALNYKSYMVDPDVTPYFLHPNNLGYERLSQFVLQKI